MWKTSLLSRIKYVWTFSHWGWRIGLVRASELPFRLEITLRLWWEVVRASTTIISSACLALYVFCICLRASLPTLRCFWRLLFYGLLPSESLPQCCGVQVQHLLFAFMNNINAGCLCTKHQLSIWHSIAESNIKTFTFRFLWHVNCRKISASSNPSILSQSPWMKSIAWNCRYATLANALDPASSEHGNADAPRNQCPTLCKRYLRFLTNHQ